MQVGDVRIDCIFANMYSAWDDKQNNPILHKEVTIDFYAEADEALTPERVYQAYKEWYNTNVRK